MLLRIGRRRESFANLDVEEVIQIEFTYDGKLDLNASIYETSEDRLIQCHAEHAASAGLDPKGGSHVDLEGLPPSDHWALLPGSPWHRSHVDLEGLPPSDPLTVKAEGHFAYTNQAHRELQIASLEELRGLVRALIESIDGRRRTTTKGQLKDYACAKGQAGDPEWLAFFRGSGNVAKTWGWQFP